MLNSLINVDEELIQDLLGKIGLSRESVQVMYPFVIAMGKSHDGLVSKGLPAEAAKQVYELALMGFFISNPSIQKEMDEISSDENKLKNALEAITKAAVDAVVKSVIKKNEQANDGNPEEIKTVH